MHQRHFTPHEHMTVRACLRVLDALGLEAWEEGESIFALEPTSSGVELVSFPADGHGLRAYLESMQ